MAVAQAATVATTMRATTAGWYTYMQVLVIGSGPQAASEMAAAEAKQQQLHKIKRVLDSMSKRDAKVSLHVTSFQRF